MEFHNRIDWWTEDLWAAVDDRFGKTNRREELGKKEEYQPEPVKNLFINGNRVEFKITNVVTESVCYYLFRISCIFELEILKSPSNACIEYLLSSESSSMSFIRVTFKVFKKAIMNLKQL